MKFDVGFFPFHLCLQVTTLVNTSNKGPSNKKRGRSKKAHVLAASVEQATENFLDKGDKIAKESQFLKEELVAAVEDVRKQGKSVDLVASQTCSAEQGENHSHCPLLLFLINLSVGAQLGMGGWVWELHGPSRD